MDLAMEICVYPITYSLIAINVAAFLIQNHKHKKYDDLGLIPNSVFNRKEYWRFVTSAFTHFSLIHILCNLYSLWQVRFLENIGTSKYITYIIIILLISGYTDCIIRYYTKELNVISAGFSGVIFGLMTIAESKMNGFNIFGFHIPFSFTTYSELIIIFLAVPGSSLIGHFAGIISGHLISWGFFEWITPLVFWSFMPWLVVFFLLNYKLSFPNSLPWFKFPKKRYPGRRAPF